MVILICTNVRNCGTEVVPGAKLEGGLKATSEGDCPCGGKLYIKGYSGAPVQIPQPQITRLRAEGLRA